jgi:microcystin-dependent protein
MPLAGLADIPQLSDAMRKCLSFAACLCLVLGLASRSYAADPYVGEIIVSGNNFCPAGWLPLNGQLLPISENEFLFQLIGTTYGGDGEQNFALPTAKPVISATGAALTQCISLFGVFPTAN